MTSKLTKTKIREIVNNPEGFVLNASIKELEGFIKTANKAYYNTGSPIVDDNTYDIIIDNFKERSPNNKVLNQIGAPVRNEIVKVKIPFWMGSMDKVKPGTPALDNWIKKYKPPYYISEKLDGLSGLLTFNINTKNEIKLYTRGDGTYGQDISHLIPFLDLNNEKHTTKVKNQEVGLRGEFIMKKSVFNKKYASKYPKARSLISGNINAKKPDINIIKDIDFVVYEVIYCCKLDDMDKKDLIPITCEDQFSLINKLGFNCVKFKTINFELSSDYLTKTLIEMKIDSEYEIDGIIITDNNLNVRNKSGNPKYAVAFKSQLEEQIAISEVLNVEWNPSKRGILIPRIQLKSFKIGGDTINYTTGFNAKYIKENKIGVGSKLKMIRSGDVIPYILEVISPSNNKKPLFPSNEIEYKWIKNEDGSKGVNIELVNKSSNKNVTIKKLVNFFTTLKIIGISEGIITKFVDNGFNTIKKICSSSYNDFLTLPGVKEKSAKKIFDGIHDVIDHPLKLNVLMAASNCFDNLGVKKLKIITDTYPTILTTKDEKITVDMINECEGYSKISSHKFIKGLKDFKLFLDENKFFKIEKKERTKTKRSKNKSSNKSINNSTNKNKKDLTHLFVVFSGFRDNQLESLLEKYGGTLQTTVNSKTNLVVAKDLNSNSSKIKKAKEMNITLINYNTFNQMLN